MNHDPQTNQPKGRKVPICQKAFGLTSQSLESVGRKEKIEIKCSVCEQPIFISKRYAAYSKTSGKCRSCINRVSATKHGLKSSPTYISWTAMKRRIKDATKPYLRKDIKVCERWLVFENFLADMGIRPDGMTLERIDNAGNYEPSNCKWATQTEQTHNQDKNMNLSAFGETKCAAEWLRDSRCSVSAASISRRIHSGWNHEKAITKPSRFMLPCTKEVDA